MESAQPPPRVFSKKARKSASSTAMRKHAHAIRQQLPGISEAIIADVTDLMQVEAAFADAVRVMDGVDVLINNAGISIRHNFLDITPEEWDKVIAVNLTGVFYVAQTAARHMMEKSLLPSAAAE